MKRDESTKADSGLVDSSDSGVILSVVVPCYCSASMIGGVVERIEDTLLMRFDAEQFEIILVNDCSPDETGRVIDEIACKDERVIAASLARNFGQQSAVMAGYSLSCGSLVMTMDDDGETPPESMFALIDKLEDDDLDVVYAAYPNNNHSWFRQFGSKINDAMACWLLRKPKDLYLSSYCLCRRFVVEQVLRHNTPFPYSSGQILATTSRIGNVYIDHGQRIQGSSGYTVRKLLSLWVNGFTAFSAKPLRLASVVGLVFALIGLLAALYVVIRSLISPSSVMGWASMTSLILVMGGSILFVLGLIGEYIGRIYMSINNLPQYIIRPPVIHNEERLSNEGD